MRHSGERKEMEEYVELRPWGRRPFVSFIICPATNTLFSCNSQIGCGSLTQTVAIFTCAAKICIMTTVLAFLGDWTSNVKGEETGRRKERDTFCSSSLRSQRGE